MSDEVRDARNERLMVKTQRASVLRDFARHEGFAMYRKELEAIVNDQKQQWLQGTDEQAKIFRYQAQGVNMALNVLKKIILDGDLAAAQLKESVENSLEPQQ